jgi:hypothetical protein
LDTDPDGLNARNPNRQSLEWEGLNYVQSLPDELNGISNSVGRVPITWFVRADGQLERAFGTPGYLLEKYSHFWTMVQNSGDEVAWHPHLYRQGSSADAITIIDDPLEAQDELERLWNKVKATLRPTSFRNGEGWHLPETFATVEQLGFDCDSTVIPGRKGGPSHPMNWEGAPNQPYFPGLHDLCKPGPLRTMIELPMNTWYLQAPYDEAPRLRYMNPAVRSDLFARALETWRVTCGLMSAELCVWVMILHPDEVLTSRGPDALYSRSIEGLCSNLLAMVEILRSLGDEFEWVTIARAAALWRADQLQGDHYSL